MALVFISSSVTFRGVQAPKALRAGNLVIFGTGHGTPILRKASSAIRSPRFDHGPVSAA